MHVCLSAAHPGNAAKAKRIKRGAALVASQSRNLHPAASAGRGGDIEVTTVLAAAEGGHRKTAVTPLSSSSVSTVTQAWEGGGLTLQSAATAGMKGVSLETADLEESELRLPVRTTTVVEEHDEENPRQQVTAGAGETEIMVRY